MKVKSRAKAEKERKNTREERQRERQRERKDKLQRRAKRREEDEKSKAERGEPDVAKAKAKKHSRSHHGAEQVDAVILKLLGKSQKSRKVRPKSRGNKVDNPKLATPKWRHGMREEKHERCTAKSNPKKKSMELRTSQASPRADTLDDTRHVEEKLLRVDIHQAVPIVDLGPGHGADGVHSSSGDGVVELGWPFGPDHAVPSSAEEVAELASPLPAQSPLDPEAFCLKFFQVKRKQFLSLTLKHLVDCLLHIVANILMQGCHQVSVLPIKTR